MDHHEGAISLAQTANGTVRICPHGCTHITFDRMTFDFDDPAQFQAMSSDVKTGFAALAPDQSFRFTHGGITLELPHLAASELVKLVDEAATALSWFSGEMEFSEDVLPRIFGDEKS